MFSQATEATLEFVNKDPDRPYLLTVQIRDMLYIGHETLNFWLTTQQVDAMWSTAHSPLMRARAERSTPGLHADG